jgi:hypothetical protein
MNSLCGTEGVRKKHLEVSRTHLAEVDPEGAHPSSSGLVVGPVAPLCQMGPAFGMFLHRLLGSI